MFKQILSYLAVLVAIVVVGFAGTHLHFPKISSSPQSTCSDRFAGGQSPTIPIVMSENAISICNDAAAILYSPKTRTPIYSAEHLTPSRIRQARQMIRENKFHEDPATGSDGPRLSDYKGSYDRGHLAPSGDQPNAESQYASFSLANMVPQNPNNNRHLWANIEESVRNYVSSNNELYVITGPIFQGATVGFINGRIAIPTRMFKAVLDPTTRKGGVYIAWNKDGNDYGVIRFEAFKRLTGIDLFPALEASAKNATPEVPLPRIGTPKEISETE